MRSIDCGQAFLNRTPIPGVSFNHDDPVIVVRGEHTGDKGSLVSLITLDPEPIFVLELDSGHDITVKQSEIALSTF